MMSRNCEKALNELYSPICYFMTIQTVNTALYMKAGRNYGQTDRKTIRFLDAPVDLLGKGCKIKYFFTNWLTDFTANSCVP